MNLSQFVKNSLHFILSTNYIFIVERSFHSKTASYDVRSHNHSSWPSLNSLSRKKKHKKQKKKNRKTSEGWPPIRIRTSIRPRDKISTTKSHMIETPKRASSSFLVTLSFKSTNTNQLHCPTARPLRIIRYQQRSPVYNILIIYRLARTICYYCWGKFKCILTLGRTRGWGRRSPPNPPRLLELFFWVFS